MILGYFYNTIPIYCGSQYVNDIFNKKAFINATNKPFSEVLDIIKEIDKYDSLYNEMINTYPFKYFIDYELYYKNKLINFVRDKI